MEFRDLRSANPPVADHALFTRAQRGSADLDKDRQRSAQVAIFTEKRTVFLQNLAADVSDAKRQAVEALHWMIEEYKISIFAQEIKTDGPISSKRLAEQVAKIQRMP